MRKSACRGFPHNLHSMTLGKAKVENAVSSGTTLDRGRRYVHHKFFSLEELNLAIRELLTKAEP